MTEHAGALNGMGALVTGAAAGIGRAVALRLARAGAHLILIDRDQEELDESKRMVEASGGAATAHIVDLASSADLTACAEDILSKGPVPVDILVNCAGITGPTGGLLDSDEGSWDTVFAVNVKAPYLLTRFCARQMVQRGVAGRIVNVTSSSAHRAHMSLPAYGASKAALGQLTRSAAADLGGHGINVNAVAPGITATRMVTDNFDKDALASALRDGPLSNLLGRLTQPNDIAETVLFLCLPGSRQITGQTIHVSAGAIV